MMSNLSSSKQLPQSLQFFVSVWTFCSSSDKGFILTTFESTSDTNSSCSFKWLKKTSITSGSLYVKISPVHLGSWATRRQENPLGLCNSFVTVFDADPFYYTGTRNVSKSQYSTIGTGIVLAKILNVKILYSVSLSCLCDGYSKRRGEWRLHFGRWEKTVQTIRTHMCRIII